MRTIKKIFTAVMNLMLVVVPVALLFGGLWLSTGPVWDVLMCAGILGLLAYSYKMYSAVRNHREKADRASFMVATVGVLVAFFALVAQAIFCHLHGNQHLLVEAAMVWLFILMVIGISKALIEDMPSSRPLAWSIILMVCWISICVIGGLFDFYEYFSGNEIPERLGNFFGALAPVTAIGGLVLFIIGIIQENRR